MRRATLLDQVQRFGAAGGALLARASGKMRPRSVLLHQTTSDNFAAYVAGTTTSVVLDTRTSGLLSAALNDGYPNGDRTRGAPGNAGGSGTDGNPAANDQNTGGGNAGSGGQGGNAWSSNQPTGGYGGADFTQATASRIIMGGGGGAGSNNDGSVASTATYPANTGLPTNNGFTSSGAAGGGIVLIRAARMSANAGTIDVSGADMNYEYPAWYRRHGGAPQLPASTS